jgi:hypothetical protein
MSPSASLAPCAPELAPPLCSAASEGASLSEHATTRAHTIPIELRRGIRLAMNAGYHGTMARGEEHAGALDPMSDPDV